MKTESSKIWNPTKLKNSTGTYSCYSSLDRTKTNSCEMKHSSKAFITELYSKNATIKGGPLFVQGYDLMHYVENLNDDEHTFLVQYCLGEYRISWWLDQIIEKQRDIEGHPTILQSLRSDP